MPFKSEKQRRYMWAEHPEIARRWAKKYPNQKDLPMYADKEKKAALDALLAGIGKFSPATGFVSNGKNQSKKADSHLSAVTLSQSEKPTYAGEEPNKLEEKPEEKVLSSEDKSQNSPLISANPEMKKLSVVLSQAVRKAMSTNGQYTPYNVGLPNRPMAPAPMQAPPPVGAAPQQPQQAQGQNPAAYQGALGGAGAISPSSNPINNYGPLSASGDVNGNAAFGVKNSPDSNKSASDFTNKLIHGATMGAAGAIPAAMYVYYQQKNKKKKPAEKPEEPKTEKKSALDLGLDPVNFLLPTVGAVAGGLRGGITGPKNKKLLSALRGATVGGLTGIGSELGFNAAKNTLGADAGGLGIGIGGGLAALLSNKLVPQVKPDKKSKKQEEKKEASSPAWQRSEGQNSEGGLNAKGRASYNKATGGNLKAPVTESNPSGERAKRQNSFCSRMCGMKSKETGAKTKADPDSRINKALSKWNCKCGSAYEFGQLLSGKSAASICSILDNKESIEEGKKVEDVKPTFQETKSKADLNPNDATNKKQDEKQATVDSYAGLSSGGQRWQLGESGINPRIGYKYLGGVVPMPDVSLRFGLPGVGGGIGLDPLPYMFADSGQPSGRHANLPRSFWKKLQDGFRSPEDAFFLELSRIKDNAPIPEYENFLRSRGVGSSSEEIGMLAKILSESTDVKRNAMAKRLPMAVNSVLKHYNPENPKSLFMGKQSSVALDIYAKYAARGDMAKKYVRKDRYFAEPSYMGQPKNQKDVAKSLQRVRKNWVYSDLRSQGAAQFGPDKVKDDAKVPPRENKDKEASIALDIYAKYAARGDQYKRHFGKALGASGEIGPRGGPLQEYQAKELKNLRSETQKRKERGAARAENYNEEADYRRARESEKRRLDNYFSSQK